MIVTIVNRIISKIKGENYTIDKNISSSYLISLLAIRFLMAIRGKLSLINNNGLLFVGSGVSLRAKHLMKFGKGVNIDNDSLINALSRNGVIFGDNVSIGKRTVIE